MLIIFICCPRTMYIFCEIDWGWGNHWSPLSSVPALYCWHNQMVTVTSSFSPSLWHTWNQYSCFLEGRFSKQGICSPLAKPKEAILGTGKEGGKIIGPDALFPGKCIWEHWFCERTNADVIRDKWSLVITIIIAFSTILLSCSCFLSP